MSSDPVLYQYDLLTGGVVAIATSPTGGVVAIATSPTGGVVAIATSPLATLGALQVGPDQKIYGALYARGSNSYGVCVIGSPNTLGAGCQFQFNAVAGFTPDHHSLLGLPNGLVRPPVPSQILVNFGLLRSTLCLGETAVFTASIYPSLPGATVTWNFGEPAAGTANTASGSTVTHQYAAVGTYLVTMTVRDASGPTYTYSQRVTIQPVTQAHLVLEPAPRCSAEPVVLRVAPIQPLGTTFRWQDGSTAAQYVATHNGRYWVEVTAPERCPARDSVTVTSLAPQVFLDSSQTICTGQQVRLTPTAQPPGTTYQWQDGSTGPTFTTTAPGTYTVTVTSGTGCSSQAQVHLPFGEDCPFLLPNVITPNGDAYNETFQVVGLEPKAWDLQVFNRWGRLVYEQRQYDGQWAAAGLAQGQYYYLLVQPTLGRRLKGWVEVIR